MSIGRFGRKHIDEKVEQQFQNLIRGLPGRQGGILSNALERIEVSTVQRWLEDGLLSEWVEQGLLVARRLSARGPGMSDAMFDSTPTLLPVFSKLEMFEWVRFLIDLEHSNSTEDFSRLPDGLIDLERGERISVYRLGRSAVYHSKEAAAGIYHTLPGVLAGLNVRIRGPLMRCLQPVASFDPEPLPSVLPFLGPTFDGLIVQKQVDVLERIAELAGIFPAGIARLFRALSRAFEEVGPEGVLTWIQTGEEIAVRNRQAAEAFFTLESRTSYQVLRHESPAVILSDVHSALVKFMHMLSGEPASVQELEGLAYPPPFAIVDEDDEYLPLPAVVDLFPTFDENFRLFCVLAAHQAGRVEFGTYALSVAKVWELVPGSVRSRTRPGSVPDGLAEFFKVFSKPNQIEALFMYIEGQRISNCLAEAYPGLRKDLDWVVKRTQLLPPFIQGIIGFLREMLKAGWTNEATVETSLLLATELFEALPSYTARMNKVGMGMQGGTGNRLDPMMQQLDPTLTPQDQNLMDRLAAILRAGKQKEKKITNLRPAAVEGVVPSDIEEDGEEEKAEQEKRKKQQLRRRDSVVGIKYIYDEWDFLIEDYRPRWCELYESSLQGDNGTFFENTMMRYADVIPEIKREFQQLRPKMYRLVKGLEDGEVIDLDAAVAARVDRITGVAPSTRLYAARQPLERDVAALFLIDLSASTDSRIYHEVDGDGSPVEGVGGSANLRVIDVLKEAVVVLSAALDEIGDDYAIYGFSSAGRQNVEVYPVKAFTEKLSDKTKGRISGMEPKRSTRMGAAVRHAVRKLKEVNSRAKMLVLLSDGFPEDADYGRDESAPMYGLKDTMMAFREAERASISSFCLTVDKSGNDYLREMCSPSRYMVLNDISSLPSELPKIYQRHVRMQLSE